MIDCLEKHNLTMSSAAAVKVIKANFNLNSKQFYYARRKWATHIPMPEYLEKLKKEGYTVVHGEWKEGFPLPEVLLIMSEQHMKYYEHFGDAVSFDITYKCVDTHIQVKDEQGR